MTRWYVGILIPDRSAQSMESAVRLLHTKLPKGTIKTATTDRGKEFSCYKVLEKDLKLMFILRMPILLGNAEVTKMEMDYFVSSSLSKQISMKYQQKN